MNVQRDSGVPGAPMVTQVQDKACQSDEGHISQQEVSIDLQPSPAEQAFGPEPIPVDSEPENGLEPRTSRKKLT